jgi:polar amino acid transport system permease protein
MATIAADTSLGPFAPDDRAPIPAARAAFAVGIGAATLAALRPILENANVAEDLRWMRTLTVAVGVLAIVIGLGAFYVSSTRGLRGRGFALWGILLGAVSSIVAIVYAANVDGTLRLGRFFDLYFDPHTLRAIAPDLARGALNTVKSAFLAEVLAVVAGLVIAVFRMSRRKIVRLPAIWYIDIVRGLPLIVLASLVAFGLPAIGVTLGTVATVVTALVINASAYVAEIFRAGIQSLPRGQMDAARSLGMTQGAAMTSVVIPQAFRAVIPPLMNEFIALIKDTALVYFVVGVTPVTRDIYTAAQQFASSSFSPTPFIGAVIGYLIMTIPLIRLVNWAERRLRAGLV